MTPHSLWQIAIFVGVVLFIGPLRAEEYNWSFELPGDAVAGDYTSEPCIHTTRYDEEYAAECGVLIVPENREDQQARLISIPIKRIHSTGDAPREPIFHLTGGPGMSNMSFNSVAWYIENHDIVLVGYRGVDGSTYLACPEAGGAMTAGSLLSQENFDALADAYGACQTRLHAEGVDTRGYDMIEVVDDVEAARDVLAYDRINLSSGSYGTRLAMFYTWRYPEISHRNAMVAVNPPGRFAWDPALLDGQIRRYAALCAEDAYCSSRTDDLVGTIERVLADFPESWMGVPIDRDTVLFGTFMGLYSIDGAAMTFDLWLSADEGDVSGMAAMTLAFRFMIPSGFAWGDSMAKAGPDYIHDPARDYIAEATPEPYLLGSPGAVLGFAGGAGWDVDRIPDEYMSVQPSDVRTLLLSGTLDVSTPHETARDDLLPYLSNGEQVVLENFAHSADLLYLQRDATRHLLTTFFASGEIDGSRFTPATVNFEPKWPMGLIAKASLGGLAVALLLLLLMVRFVVRRVRGV